jgi:hypothetical protein
VSCARRECCEAEKLYFTTCEFYALYACGYAFEAARTGGRRGKISWTLVLENGGRGKMDTDTNADRFLVCREREISAEKSFCCSERF